MSDRMLSRIAGAAMIIVGGLLSGPATATNSSTNTLYDRLGGEDFIECWIDRSLVVISRDKRINDFFSGEPNAGQPLSLRTSLIEFACAATGGPCTYSGRNMACAHVDLGIGHSDFEAFIEDLEKGAKRCQRNEPAYSELGKVLRSLRPAVVQDDPGESDLAEESCP
jgi:hemoglobin